MAGRERRITEPAGFEVCSIGTAKEKSMGWMTGFEPATSGSTIRRSNQLSYTHHEEFEEL